MTAPASTQHSRCGHIDRKIYGSPTNRPAHCGNHHEGTDQEQHTPPLMTTGHHRPPTATMKERRWTRPMDPPEGSCQTPIEVKQHLSSQASGPIHRAQRYNARSPQIQPADARRVTEKKLLVPARRNFTRLSANPPHRQGSGIDDVSARHRRGRRLRSTSQFTPEGNPRKGDQHQVGLRPGGSPN